MSHKKIIDQLKYIGRVHLGGCKNVCIIQNAFNSDKAYCVEKEWRNRFKADHEDIYPLDLTKDKMWRTYEDCASFTIEYIEGKIVCDILVWDGDNMYGEPIDQRWKARFNLDPSILGEFKYNIERAVCRLSSKKYEEKLERAKKTWITKHLTELKISVDK